MSLALLAVGAKSLGPGLRRDDEGVVCGVVGPVVGGACEGVMRCVVGLEELDDQLPLLKSASRFRGNDKGVVRGKDECVVRGKDGCVAGCRHAA